MMDDDDLEEWLDLTDAEQDAILTRESLALMKRIEAMTLKQQVAYYRWTALDSIRNNRRRLRDLDLTNLPFIENLFKSQIRRSQVRLVKLRIWRSTGIYPGATS